MSLEQRKEFPPNIREIIKKFDLHGFNPVFTYGDTLYNPTGGEISDDLMAHEETHARQQSVYGVQDWWTRYLKDDTFRMTQELEAYREQYKHACEHYPRAVRRNLLDTISSNLASKLYGQIVKKKQAKELISNYE